jgi:hypothetical protein
MNRGMRKTGLCWVAAAASGALWLCPGARAAPAQEPPEQPTTREAGQRRRAEPPHGPRRGEPPGGATQPDQPDRPGRGERGPHGRPWEGMQTHPRWARNIFEPTEEDRGPLRPGEEEELKQFVKDELPRLARVLRHIEDTNPGATRQAFPRLVPRLRLLRRIHAENPELAELIEQHAANQFRIEMLRRPWARADADGRELIESQMRACIAENLGVEADALARWADDLEANRDARVAAWLNRLTEPQADLSAEPEPVRARVEQLAAASDEAQRAELKNELSVLLTRHVDQKITAIRERVEQLRTNAPAEVDRRMEHLRAAPRSRRPLP